MLNRSFCLLERDAVYFLDQLVENTFSVLFDSPDIVEAFIASDAK